jgi:olefin beta-lactone synthetase
VNLTSLLPAQAHERGAQPAIIRTVRGSDESITFAELDEAGARAASLLREAGVVRGGRVLLLIPISIDLYIALLSVWRLGAVVTLLDPSAGLAHVDRCCALARPDALIATRKGRLLRLVCAGLRRIPTVVTAGARWRVAPPLHEIVDAMADDPALLTFTSGSTGMPKAAVRTHGLLLAQQAAVAAALEPRPGAADLTTLAVFVLNNLASGVTSVLPDADLRSPGAVNPGPVLAQMDRHTPESVVASPAFLMRLVDACRSKGRALPSLRRVFTGGAPVFWHTMDALGAVAPGARITALYGSTEAEPIAHVSLDQLSESDRAITRAGGGLPAGEPVAHVRLAVIEDCWGKPIPPLTIDEFAAKQVRVGDIGEIAVSGDHVLPGYLNGEGDRETKFRVDGRPWHRTGDAGYLDERARLWLVGRCTGRISDGHGTVYPLQVEAAAHAHADLRRCALVCHRGTRVLVVEASGSFDEAARSRLIADLHWAHLAAIARVDRIPVDRRHNAKIDYVALRGMVDGLRL